MSVFRHPRTLVVVILLPMMIAALGMWALKDRVDRLDAVPAAVVNLDEGTEIEVDGEEKFVPFGRLIAGALTQPDTLDADQELDTTGFDWMLTDQDDAEEGLKNGQYAAVVVIPENFSDDLGTLGEDDPRQARLEVLTNDASGQMNALVADVVGRVSAAALGEQLTEQYLDGIYVGFNDLNSAFNEAADGAGELSDGASELDDAANDASSAADTLADGASQSADGARALADGAKAGADGARELSNATGSLSDGANSGAGAARRLSQGLSELATGSRTLESGAGALADGSDELAGGADKAAGGARRLAGGLDDLSEGGRTLASGTSELASGLDELADGGEELADGVDELSAGLHGTGNEPGLLDAVDAVHAGVVGDNTEVNPGLQAGLNGLATGLDEYATNVENGYELLRNGDGTADNPGLVGAADGISEGVATLSGTLAGDGAGVNPGMTANAAAMQETACALAADNPDDETLNQLCAQATLNADYTGTVDTVVNGDGTVENPGLVPLTAIGAEETAAALDFLFMGDGSEINPGLVGGAQALADGARVAADGVQPLVDGVDTFHGGMHELADGVDELSGGANTLATGIRTSADAASELEDGANRLSSGAGTSATAADTLAGAAGQLADGARKGADGARELESGASTLADGVQTGADGSSALSDGLDQLAGATTQLDSATSRLADGSQELADGAIKLTDVQDQLADGSGKLATGLHQLTDGSGELADGTGELADKLREGADEVPSYTEDQREQMSQVGARPVTTTMIRENEAHGAGTATFPFVTALALWLGAFATFLLLPALEPRLLDQAMPMWRVILGSLLPAFVIGLVQSVLALAVITFIGVDPVSPIAVGVIALAGAVMFAAFHQALLTLLGDRVGRIASVVVMVLQVVGLVGIMPVETAPPLLQSISELFPLALVTRGLVHAALGGSLVTTGGILAQIAVWAVASFAVTFVTSKDARRLDSSAAARARFAAAGA